MDRVFLSVICVCVRRCVCACAFACVRECELWKVIVHALESHEEVGRGEVMYSNVGYWDPSIAQA